MIPMLEAPDRDQAARSFPLVGRGEILETVVLLIVVAFIVVATSALAALVR
jgi:hypothetical protein